LLVLAVTGLVVYFPGIGTRFYADDFAFSMDTTSTEGLYRYFTRAVPWINFYRPFQGSFLWVVQRFAGPNTAAIHVVQIILHAYLSLLVFALIRKLGFSTRRAGIGSLFMMVSQANVHAVLSNDTFSQVCSTLFGFVSVCIVFDCMDGRRTPGPATKRRMAAVLFVVLSCLSKETGVAYVAVIGVVLALAGRGARTGAWRRFVRSYIPFVLVAAAYAALWLAVVERNVSFGTGGDDIRIGANVVANIASFALAVTTPVSSVDFYVALETGNRAGSAAFLAATALFAVLVFAGLAVSGTRWRLVAALAALVVVSLFPAALLNHVSELYAYNAMPFVSVLAGIGFGGWFRPGARESLRGKAAAAGVILVFAAHSFAVGSKSVLMREAGEQSHDLLVQIESFVPLVPAGGRLVLVNPETDDVEYSVYRFNGFNVLCLGSWPVDAWSGRNDFTVTVLDQPSARQSPAVRGAAEIRLTLSGNAVTRVYTE
jgi:hypothetical protein